MLFAYGAAGVDDAMGLYDAVAHAFIDKSRRLLTDDYLVKIERSLDHLTDEDIWWRPNEASNSIGNLMLHLRGNVTMWIIGGVGRLPFERQVQPLPVLVPRVLRGTRAGSDPGSAPSPRERPVRFTRPGIERGHARAPLDHDHVADAVEGRPQLGERFVGRDNIVGMYRDLPSKPTTTWRSVLKSSGPQVR